MLRDRFQVLPSQARRLLSVLDQGGLGFVLRRGQTVVAAARCENRESICRDLVSGLLNSLLSLPAPIAKAMLAFGVVLVNIWISFLWHRGPPSSRRALYG